MGRSGSLAPVPQPPMDANEAPRVREIPTEYVRPELNEEEQDPIMPREIPTWALWMSSVVPFLLLAPMAILCVILYRRGTASSTAHQKTVEGLIAAVVLCIICNLLKRFIDILDSIRTARRLNDASEEDEDERKPPKSLQQEAAWRRCLATCLCFCLRWKHVWNIVTTSTIYQILAIAAVFFNIKNLRDGFKDPAVYAMLFFSFAFIMFIVGETFFYVWLETGRLHERTSGMIFISVYSVCVIIFLVLMWLI